MSSSTAATSFPAIAVGPILLTDPSGEHHVGGRGDQFLGRSWRHGFFQLRPCFGLFRRQDRARQHRQLDALIMQQSPRPGARHILLAVLLAAGLAGCAERQPATPPAAAATAAGRRPIGKLEDRRRAALHGCAGGARSRSHGGALSASERELDLADRSTSPSMPNLARRRSWSISGRQRHFRPRSRAAIRKDVWSRKGSQIVRDWALVGIAPAWRRSLAPIPAPGA